MRLSMDGSRVGKALLRIVQHHPGKSPVAVDILERELQQLAGRTFSATGTSTGTGDINCLRPPPTDRACGASAMPIAGLPWPRPEAMPSIA